METSSGSSKEQASERFVNPSRAGIETAADPSSSRCGERETLGSDGS